MPGVEEDANTLRDLIWIAEDFRERGLYAEGNALLDAAPAALEALLAEIGRLHDALEKIALIKKYGGADYPAVVAREMFGVARDALRD